jgi:hypothetical protein
MVFSSHWQDRNHGTVKPSYFFRLFSQNCHSVIFTSFFFFWPKQVTWPGFKVLLTMESMAKGMVRVEVKNWGR